jgi:acyl carrier protein phosphodiesterase
MKEYVDSCVASLQDEMDRRVQAQIRESEQRFSALNRATEVAKTELSARLDGMNEFRDALRDQTARSVSRELMDSVVKSLEDRIRTLEANASNLAGRFMMIGSIVSILVAAGIIVNIIVAITSHK